MDHGQLVIVDNMEANTWGTGSVMTGDDVEIMGFPFKVLEMLLIHLLKSEAIFY